MNLFGKFVAVTSRTIPYKGEDRIIHPATFVSGGDTFMFDIWSNDEYMKQRMIKTDAAGDLEISFVIRTWYDKDNKIHNTQDIRFVGFRPANVQRSVPENIAQAVEQKRQEAVTAQPVADNDMPF